jgi:hypothetical protein
MFMVILQVTAQYLLYQLQPVNRPKMCTATLLKYKLMINPAQLIQPACSEGSLNASVGNDGDRPDCFGWSSSSNWLIPSDEFLEVNTGGALDMDVVTNKRKFVFLSGREWAT